MPARAVFSALDSKCFLKRIDTTDDKIRPDLDRMLKEVF